MGKELFSVLKHNWRFSNSPVNSLMRLEQCCYFKISTSPLIIVLPFLPQFTGDKPPADATYFVPKKVAGPFEEWDLMTTSASLLTCKTKA